MTGMQGATIADAQHGRLDRLRSKIPFARASKPSEDGYGQYIADTGGMDE
jgi:hypothetical protein